MKAQFDPSMISYFLNAILMIILLSTVLGALNDPCHRDLAACQDEKALLQSENSQLRQQLLEQQTINEDLRSQLQSCITEKGKLSEELASYNNSLANCKGNLTECRDNLTNCTDIVNQIRFENNILNILLPTTFILSIISILTQLKFLLWDRDEETAGWSVLISIGILSLSSVVLFASILGWPIIEILKITMNL